MNLGSDYSSTDDEAVLFHRDLLVRVSTLNLFDENALFRSLHMNTENDSPRAIRTTAWRVYGPGRNHIGVAGAKCPIGFPFLYVYRASLQHIEKLFTRVVVARYRGVGWDYHVGDDDLEPIGYSDWRAQHLI